MKATHALIAPELCSVDYELRHFVHPLWRLRSPDKSWTRPVRLNASDLDCFAARRGSSGTNRSQAARITEVRRHACSIILVDQDLLLGRDAVPGERLCGACGVLGDLHAQGRRAAPASMSAYQDEPAALLVHDREAAAAARDASFPKGNA